MILTIPYHPTLPVDYKKFAAHLKSKGSHPSHVLAVVSLREHEDDAYAFTLGLSTAYLRHFNFTIPDAKESMLQTSNRMFKAALQFLHAYAPGRQELADPAMLYYDPTWRPVKSRWLDELQSEYYFSDGPQVFANFVNRQSDGKPLTVGPVVIAKEYPAKSTLLDFMPEGTHWRDYLAWEMFNNGVNTDAIGSSEAAYIRPYTPDK